jgi:predicted outer membrane protein
MKLGNMAVSALLILSLVGCASAKDDEPTSSTDNSKCIEIESAKLLDETGSNADYAMEKAAEICK